MGRHRHVANVRADGIAVVLGPLLRDVRILAAALVDVDSGMVLDAWSAGGALTGAPDLELIGAQHAEVLRGALQVMRTWTGAGKTAAACEVVLGTDDGCRHLLRTVPDPHGDLLALAVVVDGPQRVLDRVRRRMQAVSVDALTAGPSMTRRPSGGGWSFDPPAPDVPAAPSPGAGPLPPVRPVPGVPAPDPGRAAVAPSADPVPRPRDGLPAAAPGWPARRDPGTAPAMAGLPRPVRPVVGPAPNSTGLDGRGDGTQGPGTGGVDDRGTDDRGAEVAPLVIPDDRAARSARRPMLFSVKHGDPGPRGGTPAAAGPAAAPAAAPRRPSPPAALPAPPRPRPPQT